MDPGLDCHIFFGMTSETADLRCKAPRWVYKRKILEGENYSEELGCSPGFYVIQRDKKGTQYNMKMFALVSREQVIRALLMPVEEAEKEERRFTYNIIRGNSIGWGCHLYYNFHRSNPSMLVLDTEFSSKCAEGMRLCQILSHDNVSGFSLELVDLWVIFRSAVASLCELVLSSLKRTCPDGTDIDFSVHVSGGNKPSAHIHFSSVYFTGDRQKFKWLRALCGSDIDSNPLVFSIVDWAVLNRSGGAMRMPGSSKLGTRRYLSQAPDPELSSLSSVSLWESNRNEFALKFMFPWPKSPDDGYTMPMFLDEKPAGVMEKLSDGKSSLYFPSCCDVLSVFIGSAFGIPISISGYTMRNTSFVTVACSSCCCPDPKRPGVVHSNKNCVFINQNGVSVMCWAPSCVTAGKPFQTAYVPLPVDCLVYLKTMFPCFASVQERSTIEPEMFKTAYGEANGMLRVPDSWDLFFSDGRRVLDGETSETIADDSMRPLFDGHFIPMACERSTLIVEAVKGFGKTKAIVDLVARSAGCDVLFLTNRRVLAVTLQSKLCHLGSMIYTDYPKPHEKGVIIFQLDSICKLDESRVFDLVVLDEVSTTMPHFEYRAMRDPESVWSRFCSVVRGCRRLLAMDAFITPREKNIIGLLRGGDSMHTIVYSHRPKYGVRYIFHSCKKELTRLIIQTCEDGGRVFLASLSRVYGEAICAEINKRCGESSSIVYSSTTREDIKAEHFLDVHQHWSNYRCVVTTPTCNAGVSYEVDSHFDRTFLYGCRESAPAQTLLQMGARVRSTTTKEVHVYLQGIKPLSHTMAVPVEYDMRRDSFLQGASILSGCSRAPSIREELYLYNSKERFENVVCFYNVFVKLLMHMDADCVSYSNFSVDVKRKRDDGDACADNEEKGPDVPMSQAPLQPSTDERPAKIACGERRNLHTYNITPGNVRSAPDITSQEAGVISKSKEHGLFVDDVAAASLVKWEIRSSFGVLPDLAYEYLCNDSASKLGTFKWWWYQLSSTVRNPLGTEMFKEVSAFPKIRGVNASILKADKARLSWTTRLMACLLGLTPLNIHSGCTISEEAFSENWTNPSMRESMESMSGFVHDAASLYKKPEDQAEGEGGGVVDPTPRRVALCRKFVKRFGLSVKLTKSRRGPTAGTRSVCTESVFRSMGMGEILDSMAAERDRREAAESAGSEYLADSLCGTVPSFILPSKK